MMDFEPFQRKSFFMAHFLPLKFFSLQMQKNGVCVCVCVCVSARAGVCMSVIAYIRTLQRLKRGSCTYELNT